MGATGKREEDGATSMPFQGHFLVVGHTGMAILVFLPFSFLY